MKKLELSSGLGFHNHPIEEVDEHIRRGLILHKELGFSGVNFNYRHVDAMSEDLAAHTDRVLQTAKELGLHIDVAHLPCVSQKIGLPDGAAFDARMYKCLDAFKLLGVKYAVVHPNSTTLPLTELNAEAEYDNVMSHLSPYVDYGNKVGVNVVIENMRVVHKDVPTHRYCAAVEELCRVADALGIGVCWDTGHAHITGLKQSEAIEYVGSRLKMLHLNDNFAGDDIHLAPFQGTVDWADTMGALSKIGFNGDLNFEVGCARLPAEARVDFGKMLVTIGHKLMELM